MQYSLKIDPNDPGWPRRLSPKAIDSLRRCNKVRVVMALAGIAFLVVLPLSAVVLRSNQHWQSLVSFTSLAIFITVVVVCGILGIKYSFEIVDEVAEGLGVPRKIARRFVDVRNAELFDESIAKMQAKMRKRGIPAQPVGGGDSDGPVVRLGYRPLLATTGSVSVLLSGVAGALLGPPATGWGLNLCRAGFSLPCFGAGLGVLGIISTVLALLTATIAFRLPTTRTGGPSNDPVGPDWRHRLGEENATRLQHYRTTLRTGVIICIAYLASLGLFTVIPGGHRSTTVTIVTVICTIALAAVYLLGYTNLHAICTHVAQQTQTPAATIRHYLDLTHPARYDASLAKTHPNSPMV